MVWPGSNSETASHSYGCGKHAVQTQATDSDITNSGVAFEVEELATQGGKREAQTHIPALAP